MLESRLEDVSTAALPYGISIDQQKVNQPLSLSLSHPQSPNQTN